jgi:hypothetical protein
MKLKETILGTKMAGFKQPVYEIWPSAHLFGV